MKFKTTMRYYYTPIRIQKLKRLSIPSVDKDVNKFEPLYNVGVAVNVKWCSCYGNSMVSPQKNLKLPYEPTIPLLCMYLKEPKAESQRNICTPKYTAAAFFTIDKR